MSDKQGMEGSLAFTIDEIAEVLKKVVETGMEAMCTFNACLICSNATEDSKPLH